MIQTLRWTLYLVLYYHWILHFEIIPHQENKQSASKLNTRNVQCSFSIIWCLHQQNGWSQHQSVMHTWFQCPLVALNRRGWPLAHTALLPRWTLQAICCVHLLNDIGGCNGSLTFRWSCCLIGGASGTIHGTTVALAILAHLEIWAAVGDELPLVYTPRRHPWPARWWPRNCRRRRRT
jgi:hypothetical protein